MPDSELRLRMPCLPVHVAHIVALDRAANHTRLSVGLHRADQERPPRLMTADVWSDLNTKKTLKTEDRTCDYVEQKATFDSEL